MRIAVRSAPDPTLDMDLRFVQFLTGNFERRLVRILEGKTRFSNNVVLGKYTLKRGAGACA